MNELKYDRWLVALDLTDMDKTVVSWVNYLSSVFSPKSIYFMHVEQDFELPDYMPKHLTPSIQPSDENQRAAIEELVAENFGNAQVDVHIEVIEGKPFETLLHWAKVKKIDLFVAGRKQRKNGSGVLPHKLSRKLSCSVLFVPEIEMKGISKILVPVDFSDHSALAMKTALKLSGKVENGQIYYLHVYKVPIGFYKTGKSYEEFSELMKENSTKEFERFNKYNEDKHTFTPVLLDGGSIAELVEDEINSKKIDLVIMGSQGQTASAHLLLGSTTEKLIQTNDTSLTLVVKMKDENIGFFEALSKI